MWINNTKNMYWCCCCRCCVQCLWTLVLAMLTLWRSCCPHFPPSMPVRIVTSYLIYFCFPSVLNFVAVCCFFHSTSVSNQFPYNKAHGVFHCVHQQYSLRCAVTHGDRERERERAKRAHHNYLFIWRIYAKKDTEAAIKSNRWDRENLSRIQARIETGTYISSQLKRPNIGNCIRVVKRRWWGFYWPCIAHSMPSNDRYKVDDADRDTNSDKTVALRKSKRIKRFALRTSNTIESRSLCLLLSCSWFWILLKFYFVFAFAYWMSIVLFLILIASSEVIVIVFGLWCCCCCLLRSLFCSFGLFFFVFRMCTMQLPILK